MPLFFFKVRKMFANALVMSHILYHIQLYGGCSDNLLSAIQVQQNRAARSVCKLPWRTNTNVLLKQLGWMNVKQMVAFYSLKSFHKTKHTGLPKYIHEVISTPFIANTRIARTGGIRNRRHYTTGIGQTSFILKTIELWNNLPAAIRMETDPHTYSSMLKDWIYKNV